MLIHGRVLPIRSFTPILISRMAAETHVSHRNSSIYRISPKPSKRLAKGKGQFYYWSPEDLFY